MPTSALYKISALVTPAGTIPSIVTNELDPGIELYVQKGDGRISPAFSATMHQAPMFKGSTLGIGSALGVVGSGFYGFGSSVHLYVASLQQGAGIAAGSAHSRFTGTKGCIIPRRLTTTQKKEASLDLEGYFLSADGTTAPLSYASGVALPALAAGNEAYTLGPVSLDGDWVSGETSTEVDFGYTDIQHSSGGEMYNTFACYEDFSPTLTFKTTNVHFINTLSMGGVAIASNARFHFRRLAAAGRVADGSASHIRLTLAAGTMRPGPITLNDQGEAEMTVNVTPIDGGSSIMAVNTAATIAAT